MIPGQTPPTSLFPRRYVLQPGVASPLTCRHPKQVRCSCHGQPTVPSAKAPAPSPAEPEAPAATPAPSKAAAQKAQAEALRQVELRYQKLLGQILFAIRDFPDAAAAVRRFVGSPNPADPTPVDSHV